MNKSFVHLLWMLFLGTTIVAQNVGLGTNSPQFKLDVVGRARIQTAVLNDQQQTPGIWHTDYTNNTNMIFAGMEDRYNYGFFSNSGSIGWQFFYDARYGNVGIGRKPLSGSARLALDHSSGAQISLYADNTFKGAILVNDSNLVLNAWRGTNVLFPGGGDLILQQPGGCIVNGQFISCTYPGNVGFYVNRPMARIHMAVGSGASGVLIGGSASEPAAGYMLNVDGKVICEEVKVQLSTAWPDYVFEQDYNRLGLKDLETLVKTQKHLPGV
ncbi:MAG: hypothetical protein MUF24_02700, partial [Chitinophagaceae bacterium]|nr:hypothetical protein [Chitinophagaceae bacterium]